MLKKGPRLSKFNIIVKNIFLGIIYGNFYITIQVKKLIYQDFDIEASFKINPNVLKTSRLKSKYKIKTKENLMQGIQC